MPENHSQEIRAGSIRQRLGFLAKDSFLYGGAATLSRMLNLFILPVLTRLFSNTEYGALDVMTVTGAIFVAFIIMGQDSAIARYYYDNEDESDRKQIIAQAMVIEMILCIVVTASGWYGAEYILDKVYGIPEYADHFRLLVLSFPFVVTTRFASNLLRWTFARYQFIIVAFGSSAAVITLTLVFVVGLDLGMRGVFGAQVVANAVFAVVGLYFCRKHFTLPRSFGFGRALLRYGIPYMVVAMATCLIPAIDRALITRYMSLEVLGSYAIGYRYAFLIMLPTQAFFSAYLPFAFLIYKEPTAADTYNRVLTLVVSGLAMVAIVMVAFAEPVIELVASARYLPGYVAVVPILMGLVIQAMSQIMGIGIDLSKKTHYHLFIRSVGIAGTALFMWLLIEPLGIVGIACGFMLGKCVEAIVFTACAYHVYPLRFKWIRSVTVIMLATVGGAMMQLIGFETMPLQVGYRSAILIVFGTLIWFAMLAREERGQAIALVRGYLVRAEEPTTP